MQRTTMLKIFKISAALLGLSALVTEIVVLVGRGTFNPVNFFSFFTIEANILIVVSLLISTFVFESRKKSIAYFRGAVTLYMLIVFIVFATLLAGLDSKLLTAVPWDNTVLHYIMPVAAIIDWVADPVRVRLSFKRALAWLIVPIVYLIYSLVRGYYTGYYPYPFLHPSNGAGNVAIIIVCVAALGVVLTWVLVRVNTAGSKR